ncbi:MAG: DUF4468 domain-containing protein [Bacteroidales bacterium]|nr:DUF4468 domain-containing protein [Bacteroidales bacterium]
MKNLILTLLLAFIACGASAQLIKEKEPINPKYLAGAVPVVDGMVTFSRDLDLRSTLPADSIYHLLARWIGRHFAIDDNVLVRKNVNSSLADHRIEVGVVQYLVFRSTSLVLDRTQIIFRLVMQIENDKVKVTMTDIKYYYEEDRTPEKFTAEEWITDENALNKKKNKYVHGHGKFREKTIDLFNDIVADARFFIKDL